MTLHFNMPFSLPVIVGRCFLDPDREDQTTDLWLGSEIDPIQLGYRRHRNGQIVEHWIIVQNDLPILITYWSGMPVSLNDEDFYEVGYIAVAVPILLSLKIL